MSFNKGQVPWNKGIPRTKEVKDAVSKANKGRLLGENNPNWNPNANRGPILEWVKRRIGRPNLCNECKATESGRFVWFSISGKYKRDVADYIRLCNSCFTKKRNIDLSKNLGKFSEKGNPSWSKGLKFPERSGKNNPRWKGDQELEYGHAHAALQKIYGKPNFCEMCKRTNQKRYEWANKAGIFSRDRNNWLRLCKSCHLEYDKVVERKKRGKDGKFIS